MENIYYLSSTDFNLENGNLVANIGGLSFIMFHSMKCSHCQNFIPEFKNLNGSIRGVNFGLCSVDNNNNVIAQWSKQSSTPITAVPKFILYNDGIPYIEYSGQRNSQAVIGFLQDVIGKLNQKQSFTRPRRTREQVPQQEIQQLPQRFDQQMPSQYQQAPQQQQQQQAPQTAAFKITPSTGVKEYETSYGRPYNTLNEQDFLSYESAYKQMQSGK